MEGVKNRRVGPVASPSMVVYPKPLGGERTENFECFAPGETLGAYVQRVGITIPSRVLRVEHNGREVPLALWTRLIPRHGDMVVISARGLGGGGGGKILRTVAMIAVVVVSLGYGAALGAAIGFTGTTAAAVGSSLIMIGGSMLVNALLPMPTPTAAKLGTGQKYESSPTYSIQGGRNRARPWEPMALVFGRHKIVPDLGAKPFTQQLNNDQYLNQLFNFGPQGSALRITDIRIGDTPITNFQGVQTQISGPDGWIGMFPGNVDTLQGFALSQSNGWITRTTPADTILISVDLAARLFRVADSGAIEPRSVDVRIQYRRVGDTAWIERGSIGATFATHYWAAIIYPERVQVEYGSTNRADHDDGDQYFYEDPQTGNIRTGQWQWKPHPYQLGQPWQGIAPDPQLTPPAPGVRISGQQQEPVRWPVWWSVPQGQYEVRVMKVTADINESRESNETAVSQILVYQKDAADYSGQCRLAVQIKATGQLNGAIEELNAVASAACLTWNGTAWAVNETSNPAWWFLWFARGRKRPDGSRVYGGGLADAQIDIEGIKSWAIWCRRKNLTFDYVLDQKMSTAAVLQMIARAGRASMTYQTGKLGVVWDAEDLPITAMFGPFNVRAGSFKIAFVNEGTVDEVVANFINSENGWVMDEVRAKVPGVAATNNPLQLDLDGCIYKDMAGREANLIAASQVWKRRKITWETDIEGLVCTRGDVVSFSHDLTAWGYSGRMLPGSGGSTIKLQNKVPSSGGGIVLLRDPDGNLKTVSVTSEVGAVDELTIVTDLGGFPMPGDEGYEDCSPFDWAWQFDPIATPGRRFKVTGVAPAGEGLRFEAVDDDPEYYLSESNPYQYTPPKDGQLLSGIVFSVNATERIVSVAGDQILVAFDWVLSRDMPALASVLVNGVERLSQIVPGRRAEIMVSTGDALTITITPKGSTGAGQPNSISLVVQGLLAPLPAVQGLTSVFRDGLTALVWNQVSDIRQPLYEVRIGTSWADARTVVVTPSLETLAVGNGLYWVAARFQTGSKVIYGPPDSLLIAGAILVRNVLVTVNEHPGWDGDLAGGAIVHDGELTLTGSGDILAADDVLSLDDVLFYGGVVSDGTYETNDANIVDIGYATPVRVDFNIDEYALNFRENVLSMEDVLAVDDFLNGSNRQFYHVSPQIRHAQVEGDWSEWRDYVPGTINARFFDVRVVLRTSDPLIVPFVRAFTWTIDVPDLLQQGTEITIPAEGLRITFPKQFHATPNIQVTALDAQDGDREVITNTDLEGFDIQMVNVTTPVERVINWIAQRY